jgi:hypothetical protein
MNGMTRKLISGRAALTVLATAGAVAAPLWLGHMPGPAAAAGVGPITFERNQNAGRAEGRISGVTSRDDLSTVVWLADGTRLIVPIYAQRGAEPVLVGNDAQARYRESEGDKVVTEFSVVPHIEAP